MLRVVWLQAATSQAPKCVVRWRETWSHFLRVRFFLDANFANDREFKRYHSLFRKLKLVVTETVKTLAGLRVNLSVFADTPTCTLGRNS